MSEFRILERTSCPGCKREVNPKRRHKTNPGGLQWCSGQRNEPRERAVKALVAVHSAAADLILAGRYDEALALLRPSFERLPGKSDLLAR